jgi:multicomponent Na+:H+ antiporter subunit G
VTAAILADIASWIFIIAGSAGLMIGGIGILRLPDVYTRMHAAGVTDTLGAGGIIIGLAIQAGFGLVAVKLLMVLVFLFFTSPASSFSLAHAALSSGVEPILDSDLTESDHQNGDDPHDVEPAP